MSTFTPLKWGYEHKKTVCHGRGEYACDEDGDGFCEVSTRWRDFCLSLWLRPIEASLKKSYLVLGLFEFVHNAKKARESLVESCWRPFT